jgi:hypothetical protein
MRTRTRTSKKGRCQQTHAPHLTLHFKGVGRRDLHGALVFLLDPRFNRVWRVAACHLRVLRLKPDMYNFGFFQIRRNGRDIDVFVNFIKRQNP